MAADRVLEGIAMFQPDCDSPFRGVPLDEVLNYYGGRQHVHGCCRECPANASAARRPAGCFGLLTIGFQGNSLHDHLEQIAWDAATADRWAAVFPPTHPRGYGIWIKGSLTGTSLPWLAELLAQCNVPESLELAEFQRALQIGSRNDLTMDVQLVPRGFSDGTVWTILPHCANCRAAMPRDAARCNVCGRRGGAHGEIRRKVRGFHPFVELDRLVGPRRAQALVQKLAGKTHP